MRCLLRHTRVVGWFATPATTVPVLVARHVCEISKDARSVHLLFGGFRCLLCDCYLVEIISTSEVRHHQFRAPDSCRTRGYPGGYSGITVKFRNSFCASVNHTQYVVLRVDYLPSTDKAEIRRLLINILRQPDDGSELDNETNLIVMESKRGGRWKSIGDVEWGELAVGGIKDFEVTAIDEFYVDRFEIDTDASSYLFPKSVNRTTYRITQGHLKVINNRYIGEFEGWPPSWRNTFRTPQNDEPPNRRATC